MEGGEPAVYPLSCASDTLIMRIAVCAWFLEDQPKRPLGTAMKANHPPGPPMVCASIDRLWFHFGLIQIEIGVGVEFVLRL